MAEKQAALKQAPQVRPDLPAWHRAAPLMPSRESGDGGGGDGPSGTQTCCQVPG